MFTRQWLTSASVVIHYVMFLLTFTKCNLLITHLHTNHPHAYYRSFRGGVSDSSHLLKEMLEPQLRPFPKKTFAIVTLMSPFTDRNVSRDSQVFYNTMPCLAVECHALPGTTRKCSSTFSSTSDVITFIFGNSVQIFFTPSGAAIKLRNRIRDSLTPLSFSTYVCTRIIRNSSFKSYKTG